MAETKTRKEAKRTTEASAEEPAGEEAGGVKGHLVNKGREPATGGRTGSWQLRQSGSGGRGH